MNEILYLDLNGMRSRDLAYHLNLLHWELESVAFESMCSVVLLFVFFNSVFF